MEIHENEQITETKRTKRLGTGLVASIVILSILTGAFSGFVSGWYAAKRMPAEIRQKTTLLQEDSAVIDVVHKSIPAVVSIVVSKEVSQNTSFSDPFFFDPFGQFFQQQQTSKPQVLETGAGTGFFVSSDGLIVTNKHVVEDTDAKYTVVTNEGKKYEAKVLARDPLNDIALVKVDIKDAPYLNLADSSKLEIGQGVIAIGNSLGEYSNTVTTGVISGIGRNITAGGIGISEELENVIQTDAAINPGNSGGPLLNTLGEVIAMNTAIAQSGQLIGFAIPANDIKKDVDVYKSKGKISRPYLGVAYVLINPALKEQENLPVENGAWITTGNGSQGDNAVISGSPAEKAGIKTNDIILEIDGKKITPDNSLAELLKGYNPGSTVKLKVLRNNKEIEVSVTLGEK